MLGKKGNFAVEWCRVFNQVAFALGALKESAGPTLDLS